MFGCEIVFVSGLPIQARADLAVVTASQSGMRALDAAHMSRKKQPGVMEHALCPGRHRQAQQTSGMEGLLAGETAWCGPNPWATEHTVLRWLLPPLTPTSRNKNQQGQQEAALPGPGQAGCASARDKAQNTSIMISCDYAHWRACAPPPTQTPPQKL